MLLKNHLKASQNQNEKQNLKLNRTHSPKKIQFKSLALEPFFKNFNKTLNASNNFLMFIYIRAYHVSGTVLSTL